MEEVTQSEVVASVFAPRFLSVQTAKMWKKFPDILREFIHLALKRNLIFVIAGSFAAYSIGAVDGFNDYDVYIQGTMHSLTEFHPFYNRLVYDEEIFIQYKSRIDRSAKLNGEKVKRLAICNVLPYWHYTNKIIDFVFAPLADCSQVKLYGMYVMKSFDIAATRVCIYWPFPDDTNFIEYLNLQLPTLEYVDEKRKIKYEKRKCNLQPSTLALLSLNALIDSDQIIL